MADYDIVNGVASAYPKKHYGGHFVNGRVTFCETADLQSPSSNILAVPNGPVTVLTSSRVSVAPEFFGVSVQHRANDISLPIVAKTVRTHDINGGKGRWRFIEPTDNNWDFTTLDLWVNAHYAAGRDLLFTLYGTPQWASARPSELGVYGSGNLGTQAEPADMTKWDRFCTTIATRYRGKIKYYEVWNEPNISNNGATTSGTNFFFSGTFAKLAEMVRRANQAIKAVDPTAKIISPAVTNWSSTAGQSAETYFTGMMAAATGDGSTTMKDWVDIIGVHLYLTNNSTLALAGMIDRVIAAKATAGVSAKETWDTESAPIEVHATSMSDGQMERYLTRFMLTLAAKGVARTIYYQLDHGTMGFLDRSRVYAYWRDLRDLLIGGRVLTVSKMFDGRLAYTTSSGQVIV